MRQFDTRLPKRSALCSVFDRHSVGRERSTGVAAVAGDFAEREVWHRKGRHRCFVVEFRFGQDESVERAVKFVDRHDYAVNGRQTMARFVYVLAGQRR